MLNTVYENKVDPKILILHIPITFVGKFDWKLIDAYPPLLFHGGLRYQYDNFSENLIFW